MNYTTGYETYEISELLEKYNEAKYMSFMCLHFQDRGNWRKWCRTCAEINLTIHMKQQEQTA
jgi:hypothetical protein